MNQATFLLEIKKHFSEDTWPWLIICLRQDELIWDRLVKSDLGGRALNVLPGRPESWSPASLALLELGETTPIESLSSLPLRPLASLLRLRVTRAYEDWCNQTIAAPLTLEQSGLIALSLRERRRLKDSWEGLTSELGQRIFELPTALACLYGLAPDPFSFLCALLQPPTKTAGGKEPGGSKEHSDPDSEKRIQLAIHILLSNPLIEEAQVEILHALLGETTLPVRLRVIEKLALRRSTLSQGLAKRLIESEPLVKDLSIPVSPGLTTLPIAVESLGKLISRAQICGLGSDPEQAAKLWDETLQFTRRLEAEISAQVARNLGNNINIAAVPGQAAVVEASTDHLSAVARSVPGEGKTQPADVGQSPNHALEAWQQAVALAPHEASYRSSLVLALLRAGRLDEAQTALDDAIHHIAAASGGEVDQAPDRPALLIAQALLVGQRGDAESACQFVDRALQAVASQPDDLLGIAPAVISLLLDLGRPVESARVARFALQQQPNDPALLSLHARALLAMGDAQAALQSTVSALSSKLAASSNTSDEEEPPAPPDDLAILWIQCLEAAEEWREAFTERSKLLQRLPDQANSAGLWALAHSALRAGLPQEAAQTIQRAILLDPEDGLAYALFGEADLANGEIDAAIEHFSQATELAPHLSATWMSLSQAYQRAGQDGKAFETLRSASLAVPESADVQFALGQAYLGQNALTQALTCFRRAATLLSTHSQLVAGQSIESALYSDDAKTKPSTLAGKVALLLGQTLYQLGHLEESRQVLGAAYETSRVKAVLPDTVSAASPVRPDPQLAYAYARTLLALNDLRPALAPLKDTIENRPAEPLPYLEYARTLLAISEPPERAAQRAIPYLQRVLEMVADRFGKAGVQIDEGSDQDAENQEIRIEAQLLLAESLAEIGELENANRTFHQTMELALAQQPGWRARLNYGLGRVSYRLGQYETAIAALQEAAHLDTQNASTHRWLSQSYQMLGLPDNAFQAARAALQRAPSNIEFLIWFADQCLQIRQMPGSSQLPTQFEAIQALSRAVQQVPHRTDLLVRLGQLQIENGNRFDALETFGKLVKAQVKSVDDRNDTQATTAELFTAAQSLRQLGDAAGAITLLEQARAMPTAGCDTPQKYQLLAELAAAHRQAGQVESALQALNEALQEAPTDANLPREKVDLLQEMGRSQEALVCLESALRQSPDDSNLHQRAALILRTIGDLPAALAHAEQALTCFALETQAPNVFETLVTRSLAADLARAMLQSQRAAQLLGEPWPDGQDQSSSGKEQSQSNDLKYLRFEEACQRAELALEAGDVPLAERSAAQAQTLIPNHPREMAIHARLIAHQDARDLTSGLKWLRSAFEVLKDQQLETEVDLSHPTVMVSVATRRALAEAALELGQWDSGLSLLRDVVKNVPNEPLSHFQLARAFTLRAEAQRICQALEVVQHAPGPQALAKDAQRAFESAIQSAIDQMNAWCQKQQPADDASPYSIAILPSTLDELKRWQARGAAAFQPDPQTAQAFVATLHVEQSSAEEVAASVAALGAVGEHDAAMRSAQAYPSHPKVLAQLALALAEANPRQALGIASSAVTAADLPGLRGVFPRPMLHILHARLAYRVGARADDAAAARQAVQAALELWPDEPRWQGLAADIAMTQDDANQSQSLDRAAQHLEKAVHLEPKHAPHYLSLGKIYMNKGEQQRAISAFEQASRIAPDQPDAWLALARARYATGDLEQAAANAERAVEHSEDPTEALLLRGEIALQAENPRGALSRAQSVLRRQPEHPYALHLLAQSLDALDRPAEAVEVLQKAIPLASNPQPLEMERARLLRRSAGLDASIAALEEMAERYPMQSCFLAPLAHALMEAGQSEAAIQTARLALQSNSSGDLSAGEQANLHFLIGRQLRRMGQLDQAIHYLSEATRLSPSHLEAYLELGRTHQERRQHAQAVMIYQQAINLAGKDYRPYYQAGLALKESKDYLGAEDMLRHAAELAPDDVSIHRLLGAVVALNLVHNRRQATPTV